MAHLYFHVSNGNGLTLDDEGLDVENQAAARQIALDSIRSMVSEDARRGVIDLNASIQIKDEADNLLSTVDYIEAFKFSGPTGDKRLYQ